MALRTIAGSRQTRVSLLGQQGVRVLLVVSEVPPVALQPHLVNHLISLFEPDILGLLVLNGGKGSGVEAGSIFYCFSSRVSRERVVLVAIVGKSCLK